MALNEHKVKILISLAKDFSPSGKKFDENYCEVSENYFELCFSSEYSASMKESSKRDIFMEFCRCTIAAEYCEGLSTFLQYLKLFRAINTRVYNYLPGHWKAALSLEEMDLHHDLSI